MQQVTDGNVAAPLGCAVAVVNESLSVYLNLQGSLSADVELDRLRKKMDEVQK